MPPACAPESPTGTEPWGLYNVVLFLLHDRSGSGWVSLEDAMKITYLRVGKVGFAGCLAREEAWGLIDASGLHSGCLLGMYA